MPSLLGTIPWLTSLRSRLLLLVLLAALPAALLVTYSAYREQAFALEAATNRLRHTAGLAAADLEQPINGAQYTLAALAHVDAVRLAQEPGCSRTLADVLGTGKRYTGFAVLGADGRTLPCRTANMDPAARYGDREPFKRALASRELAAGKPLIGRGTGKAVIPLFFPLVDGAGEVERVLAAGLDVNWIATRIDETIPETGLTLLILDREGTVFFRYPENERWIGRHAADSLVIEAARTAIQSGSMQEPGLDGVLRLYGVAPVDDYPELGLLVAVGMPLEGITGPARGALAVNLLILALVTALALGGSWLLGDLTIRRRVAGLIEVAGRIGRGGRARLGRVYEGDEFGVLARAFDDMADALERQVADIRRGEVELLGLNRTLRTLSKCNRALVKAESEQELLQEVCRIAVDTGGYRMAWVGYAQQDDTKSVVPAAWAGHEDGYLQGADVSWADTERGRGPTGTAIRTGVLAVVHDIAKDPHYGPWKEGAAARGYASSIALPLEVNERTIGAVTIHAGDLDAFGRQEIELLVDLAGDLSYGIAALRVRALHAQAEEHRKRAQAEILRLNADLERRVEERTAELEASRRALEDLYNRAPCGYHSMDDEGRIIRINDTELEWLGYRRDQVEGKMNIADMLTTDSLRVFRRIFPGFKESGRVTDLEMDFVRGDGTVLSVSINATAVRDAEGRFVMSRSTMVDIGGRKRIEIEINRLNQDLRQRAALLEAANKELESFSYSVSHDLRAPLRAVDGFAQILEEDYSGRLDGEGLETVAVIRQSTQRMGHLIDDLLAFSRLGRTEVDAVEVDMAQLAHSALQEACEAAARPPALTIAPLPPAWGDRALLQQVWRNLVSNAVKFSAKVQAPEIHISARMESSGPVYCVRDNGAGFDMRYYDKLFGVFQRLHAADEYPGTGVGLAIVQRIVARHGGRVWAESTIGEGASFFFLLPKGREM